MLNCSSFS